MAITPKKIIGTAVGLGRGAFSLGAGLLRRDETSERPTTPATPAATSSPATARGTTSGAPSTVGAPKPGEPRGVKSATAPTASRPPAAETKAPAAKPSAKTKAAAKAKARPKAVPAAPRKKGPTSKTQEV
jgi:hypothetical protein